MWQNEHLQWSVSIGGSLRALFAPVQKQIYTDPEKTKFQQNLQLTETIKAYFHASLFTKHPSCTYAPLSMVFLATQSDQDSVIKTFFFLLVGTLYTLIPASYLCMYSHKSHPLKYVMLILVSLVAVLAPMHYPSKQAQAYSIKVRTNHRDHFWPT